MPVDQEAVKIQINAAMKEKLLIKFYYRKPDDGMAIRRGVPYEIDSTKDGNELVRCYDIDRGEVRAFRLDRFETDNVEFFHPQTFISEEKWEAINEMYLTA